MSVYAPTVRLGLTGDVMLGRLVDERILGDPGTDPAYIWGDVLDLFAAADARFVNLECVVAASGLPDIRKVFRFRARPRALDALKAARVTFAGLANNHVLDYGPEAMLECLTLLRASQIAVAGAGKNVEEASAAATITAKTLKVAVLAITDNEPGWEAEEDRPGVNFVRCDAHGLVRPYRERIRDAIDAAREAAEVVVVCAHLGPNWGPPTQAMQVLARQVLGFGAQVYWGHSNHSVQAIELHGGRAILYSTGDFVDDYAVDPEERNDLSFFFEVLVRDAAVDSVRLHPVRIEGLRVHRASPDDARWLGRRMELLSRPHGTCVGEEEGVVVLTPG